MGELGILISMFSDLQPLADHFIFRFGYTSLDFIKLLQAVKIYFQGFYQMKIILEILTLLLNWTNQYCICSSLRRSHLICDFKQKSNGHFLARKLRKIYVLITVKLQAVDTPVYYSILNSFGLRSQNISIKFPLHKQSENP